MRSSRHPSARFRALRREPSTESSTPKASANATGEIEAGAEVPPLIYDATPARSVPPGSASSLHDRPQDRPPILDNNLEVDSPPELLAQLRARFAHGASHRVERDVGRRLSLLSSTLDELCVDLPQALFGQVGRAPRTT